MSENLANAEIQTAPSRRMLYLLVAAFEFHDLNLWLTNCLRLLKPEPFLFLLICSSLIVGFFCPAYHTTQSSFMKQGFFPFDGMCPLVYLILSMRLSNGKLHTLRVCFLLLKRINFSRIESFRSKTTTNVKLEKTQGIRYPLKVTIVRH